MPVRVADPSGFSGKWASVAVGDFFVCGIDSDGAGYCWGRGDLGMLGNGGDKDKDSPVAVASPSGFSGSWKRIVAGQSRACGVDSSGARFCWGAGNTASLPDDFSPVGVPAPANGTWQAIHVGTHFQCGLVSDGTILCWGDDWIGSVGNGPDGEFVAAPAPIDSTVKFQQIGLDGESYHVCAVSLSNDVYCWGRNSNGQTGVPPATTTVHSPLKLTGHALSRVAVGEFVSCGVDLVGAALCWGQGKNGELGDGLLTTSSIPVKVADPQPAP